MSYVGSTLSWLVILLPRDRIDLALYLVFLVAIGLSAAGMAAYLHVIRPTGKVWVVGPGGRLVRRERLAGRSRVHDRVAERRCRLPRSFA